MTAGVAFQLSSERNVGSRKEAVFFSLSRNTCPRGARNFHQGDNGHRPKNRTFSVQVSIVNARSSAVLYMFLVVRAISGRAIGFGTSLFFPFSLLLPHFQLVFQSLGARGLSEQLCPTGTKGADPKTEHPASTCSKSWREALLGGNS